MPRAVILTALQVEFLAVRAHLTDIQEAIHPQGTIYERGKFVANASTWDVGIAEVGAGNAGAAVEAERAITYFKPDILFFVGIAGGIKDVAIGDVVAATKIYGYESGKVGEQFFTHPALGQSAHALVQRARAEARKREWLQRLSNTPDPLPCVFIAPIAAGEKVIASTASEIFQFLRSNYEDAIAVEMEGLGFLEAARSNQRVSAMVIRGISDLIDGKAEADKAGSQEIAARHASAFAFELLANFQTDAPSNSPQGDTMTQHNYGNSTGYQTKVEGGTVYISTHISATADQPASTRMTAYIPNLPSHLLERSTDLNTLKNLVLPSSVQSVGITGTTLKVGLHGMGGIGKSVLAAMLARDQEVQAAFPDGVFWIPLGQEPILTLRQLDLARMLGDASLTFQDTQQGKVHLSQLLGDKTCLLILDDVWQVDHVAAFNVLGEQSRLLLTTRDSSIVKTFNAFEHQIALLGDEDALELLATCSGQCKETLPIEAHEIVRECGNLPLALSMIGAIARDNLNLWVGLLQKLRNADLAKIWYDFPSDQYLYKDLLKAMQVSVEALEELEVRIPGLRTRYLDFAVFSENVAIPETTLKTFWEPEGLDDYDTARAIAVLVDRSLARRDETGNLSLHDLQYDYVRKQVTDFPALHNKLLEAYATHCPQGWHTYPTSDEYFFEHLACHLKKAGRRDELFTLARSLEFAEIQRRVFWNAPSVLLKTTQTALKGAVEIDDPPEIAEFSLRHAHQLAETSKTESPLQALRSGNMNRALELIELHQSVESYILWSLLLAWELKEAGQEEAVRSILRKLHDRFRSTELRDLPSKELWQGHLAANMLAQIFELDPAGCTILSQRLLGKPGSVCWSTLQDMLCKRGLFPEAIELRKQQDAVYHLTEIAELQAQKVSPETAETTYWEIISFLKLWRRQSHCIYLVASSARTLLEMGFNPLAKRIFAHLTKVASEIQNFADKIESLLYITDHQIEASAIDRSLLQNASKTLDGIDICEIFDSHIKAKVLGKIAKLNAKLGDSAQARAFFDEALEITQTIAELENKQSTLGEIVHDQLSVRFTADALETIKQMVDDTRQSSAVSHILSQHMEEQDFEAAFTAVEQVCPDWDKARGLQDIAQAQAEAGQLKEAIGTVELVSDDFNKSSAWSSIVKAQAQNLFKVEDSSITLDEIFETIEKKIPSHHVRAQALKEIAAMQLGQKDFTAALQTFERLKFPDDRASADQMLATAYAKNGGFDQALAIARQICGSRFQLEAFKSIAQIQLKEGRSNDARETYAEMFSLSVEFDISSLKAVTLINIANTQIERGQAQTATTTLQRATENIDLINDLYKKSQFLAFLAEKWMQIGNVKLGERTFDQAIERAEEFQREQTGTLHTSRVFATIATSQATTEDFDAALKTAEKISFLSLKSEVYRAVANAHKKSDNLVTQENFKEVFAEAYEEFQKSPKLPFESSVEIFCNLAIARFTIGDELAASEILAQLHQEVREDDDHQNRSGNLATIAISYIHISDLNAAIAMLNEIELPKWHIRTLWVIAYNQFKQKQVEAVQESFQLAIQAYQEIQDEKQRAEVAGIFAKIQALAGEYHQAIRCAENALDQHVKLLPSLANIFMNIGEAECFKQLIVPCSYYLESAYEMCQSLAQLYPEQSGAIANVVRNFHWQKAQAEYKRL